MRNEQLPTNPRPPIAPHAPSDRGSDTPASAGNAPSAAARRHPPMLMYGILVFSFGTMMYLLGVLMVFPRYLLGLQAQLLPLNERMARPVCK